LERLLSKKKRVRRRLRIAKRVLLLVILSILVFGVSALGARVYRWVRFPAVRYEQVVSVDNAIFVGHALVARDQLALVAPRGGVLNVLVDHGSPVRAGDKVFELVDVSLMSSADKQLRELENADTAHSLSEEEVTQRRQQFALALARVRQIARDLSYATRFGKDSIADRNWRKITLAQKASKQLEKAYVNGNRSEEAKVRRTTLIAQRSEAIHKVRAPMAGFLSLARGGQAPEIGIVHYESITLDDLRSKRSSFITMLNGDQVSAGQVAGVILDATEAVLVIELPAETVVPEVVDIDLGDVVLQANLLQNRPSGVDGIAIVALRVDNPPFLALEQKFLEVKVSPRGVVLSSIPSSAIVAGEVATVFIKEAEGKHLEREVVVVERKGRNAIVQGLSSHEVVVVNPRRLQMPGSSP